MLVMGAVQLSKKYHVPSAGYLGLTNAKRLVENNGGQMMIQSTEGQGTEVVLRFLTAVRAGTEKEEACLNQRS